MADIRVIITESGDPYAIDFEEAVIPEEDITWHIFSFRKDVSRVKIAFADPTANYFGTPTSTITAYEKDLTPESYDSAKGTYVNRAMIWGETPDFAKRTENKYDVIGYDSTGKEVTRLDPKIIVDGP